ncbi:fibronectin type III domain-containing protein, partial [Flavobacteriales bacterium]|nr:fibronectin type III domain-containing protein [Flavobacteriales bacterium]
MKKIYLLLFALFFSFSSYSQTGMLNGTGYAPNFTVTDINGTSHTLYNYLDSGYVMVLELLSVTCGHCINYAPGTENSYQTNGPNGTNVARFLGLEVNSSTDSTAIANFMSTYGVTFPIADNVSPVGINYQLYYTPSYFVVYPDRSYTTLCPLYCVTTSSYSTIESQLDNAIAAWVPPVSGCMDSLAFNYDSLATVDDSSCYYCNPINTAPTNLSVNWVTRSKAEIAWDNMNDSCNMVWKYHVRYKAIGDTVWTTKSSGVGNGLCNFGLNTTSKTLRNLYGYTTYEYKMKAFYCGGTESNYSAPSQFTTSMACPPMSSLTATTFNANQSKVRFEWDTTSTLGTYVFARVLLRVDTLGASWQTAGGFGVYYPQSYVTKFGLQPGESYRATGRLFCDSNVTSHKSLYLANPIFWTQPGTIRMGGG